MKQMTPRFYAGCATAFILVAVLLRLLILARGWPQLNSDEGTMGIMALHIAYQGKFPLIFYGQDYMGTIEAYLGALMFHLFGPTTLALRLGLLLLFALFLVAMYLLISRLYSRKLAVISLCLLSLGGREVLFRQLEAVSGSPEVVLFGALLLLVAVGLALSSIPSGHCEAHERRRRNLLFGLWGLLAGLALWSDPLVAPFVLVPALLFLLFCLRELRTLAPLLLLAGLLLGVSPYLLNKVLPSQTSPSMQLFHADPHTQTPRFVSDQGQVASPPTFGLQLTGMFLVSLPIATGANSLCTLSAAEAWPLPEHPSAHVLQCTLVHAGWSSLCILLWLVAVTLALRAYLRARRAEEDPERSDAHKLRGERILQASRLAVLGSAGLTLALYTAFPSPAIVPWSSTRYLVGLFIAAPALLAALWIVTDALRRRGQRVLALAGVATRYGLLLIIVISQLSGLVAAIVSAPDSTTGTLQMDQLIATMVRAGDTRVYSDYWTCDRLIFQSQERIICSVLDEQLQPALDRYLPYRALVASSPHSAFLFHRDAPQVAAFKAWAAQSHMQYSTLTLTTLNYVIYRPV